ncbi:hypothetical protein MBRA1_000548 [Malassezia brasiliensis]|uniref:Thioesterase domain-containing protein n=1 Tax=Malassezia brasiliensis TaxID=1821822 RepID=A0AAF0DR58_9BASI|nr:hypothetical protein MBRA1_000548 [Malassezia brasiliensis]
MTSLLRRAVFRTSPVRAARMYSTQTLPSMEEIRAEQDRREQEIREAESAVAALGYPEQGIYRQQVVWADLDQFRHVNNAHYIRWIENARMFWFRQLARNLPPSLHQDIEEGRNIGVILATNYCRYRRPLNFPDTALVSTAVKMPLERDDRFKTRSVIYSVNQRAVVAEGENDIVTYDYNKLQKAPMPQPFREALEAWAYRGK